MIRTWKPTTAGILTIIAGALELAIGLRTLLRGEFARRFFLHPTGTGIGAVLIVLAIVAVIGGILALRRQAWGLALAGAICALFPPSAASVLGILALIFVSLSKNEFGKTPIMPQA